VARERAIRAHGQDPAAERSALEAAVRFDPLDAEARSNLAGVLAGSAEAHDRARALAEARSAARLDPRTPHLWWELAGIEIGAGRPALAWTHAARAESLYPLKPDYRDGLTALESRLFPTSRAGAPP